MDRPNLSKMTRDELNEYAATISYGLVLSLDTTHMANKTEVIEAIEAAWKEQDAMAATLDTLGDVMQADTTDSPVVAEEGTASPLVAEEPAPPLVAEEPAPPIVQEVPATNVVPVTQTNPLQVAHVNRKW